MLKASVSTLALTRIAPSPVSEGRFVLVDGAVSGADGRVLGVAQSDAETGEAYAATVVGIVDMVAGAAIEVGDYVVSNAAGLPVPKGAGVNVAGLALNGAALGGRVTILMK